MNTTNTTNNNFAANMSKLFLLLFDEPKMSEKDRETLDLILSFFESPKDGLSFDWVGIYELTYMLTACGFIELSNDGKIDIQKSNRKDMAELLAPFVAEDIATHIKKQFENKRK